MDRPSRTVTLAEGRPSRAKHPRVREPDFDALVESVQTSTRSQLEERTDLLERLKRTVDKIKVTAPLVEAARAERDEVILAAVIHHDARSTHRAAGISPNMVFKLKDSFRAAHFTGDPDTPLTEALKEAVKHTDLPQHPNWMTELPEVGERWTIVATELATAKKVRNETVVQLLDDGQISQLEAAHQIGTSPGPTFSSSPSQPSPATHPVKTSASPSVRR
jgi:hypothetical protein